MWGYLAHRRFGVPEWVMVVVAIIGGLIAAPCLLVGLGWFVVMVVVDDTVYSEGYRESAFRGLRVGMTTEQVEVAIGPPLRRTPGGTPREESWDFARSRSGEGNRYIRSIEFRDGKVSKLYADYFFD